MDSGTEDSQSSPKRPRQQPAHPPIRQLLGAADAQTAHPATSSTAPAHQPLGSANAETTPARAPGHSGRQNAATRRNMRREERVTVQGPVKEQRPDGMAHRGGGGGGTMGWEGAMRHPALCSAYGTGGGAGMRAKTFVYLKWASDFWRCIQNFIPPQRKFFWCWGWVGGGGLAWGVWADMPLASGRETGSQ